jgi:WD40 repeat protein
MSDAKTPSGGPEIPPSTEPPVIPEFELIRAIGRGSYGEVWLARNIMGAYRAIKVIYRDTFDNDRPFEREFTGIERYEPVSRTHESQLAVLHVGRNHGYFYYVMELADDQFTGQVIDPDHYAPKTLRSELFSSGGLPFREALEIAISLSTALEHLHKNGLVHRDIKPSNIIFVNGIPKLADIGLVTSVDATRSYVGTEGFLPPEGPGTAQADIYSLGKVFYEMLTGLDRQDYPDLPTTFSELPDREGFLELNSIIAKACNAGPQERYQSARELHSDLILLQSGKSVRRLRSMERRIARITRAGIAATIVGGILAGAFLFQRFQTSEARQLAAENRELAEDKGRLTEESRRLAEESRENLVRMLVANGNRLVDENNNFEALLWFAEALKLVEGDSAKEEVHRVRINSVLGESPRILQIFQHGDSVRWCEFSPDGKWLATASRDKTARVWDVLNGAPASPPIRHADAVRSVAFSPDGKWIVTASHDKTARVWEAGTGHPVSPPLLHEDWVLAASFSPDGTRVLTASRDEKAILWDAATGEIQSGPFRSENVFSVSPSFSPDGQRFLTVTDRFYVAVRDANTGEIMFPPIDTGTRTDRPYPTNHTFVNVALFSPDGEFILTGTGSILLSRDRGVARVWSAKTGEPITHPMEHESAVFRAAFSEDGFRLATVDYQGTVKLWDARTGEQLGPGLQEKGVPLHIAFSPEGSSLAFSMKHFTHLWSNNSTPHPVSRLLLHGGWSDRIAFSPNGLFLATVSRDHLVRVWDVQTAGGPQAHLLSDDTLYDASFSPDGRRVLLCYGRTVGGSFRIRDAVNGTSVVSEVRLPAAVGLGVFSPDGTKALLAAGTRWFLENSTNAWVFDAKKGEKLFDLPHLGQVSHAAFSPDGRYILTTSHDHTARIWDATSGLPLGVVLKHDNAIQHGSFSPDGSRVVSASSDGSAQVWEWSSGDQVFSAFKHSEPVRCALYSPDGRRIATAGLDMTIRIWDAHTGQAVTPPLKQEGSVLGLAFTPDGKAIVSWGNFTSGMIWSSESGERLLPPLLHQGNIRAAEFSPDGHYISTASEDRFARLWDASTGESVASYRQGGTVYQGRFDPEGRRFLTVTCTRAARLWKINPLSWPDQDVKLLARVLSSHELDQTFARRPLASDEIVSAFSTLRSQRPEFFQTTPEERRNSHLAQAKESEFFNDWEAAIYHLSHLIVIEPNTPDYYQRRAEARASLGLWKEAVPDLEKSLEFSGRPRLRDLVICLKAGERRLGRTIAEGLIEAAGKSRSFSRKEDVTRHCGLVPDLLSDYSASIALAEEAFRSDPNSDRFQAALALQYYRAGRMEDAVRITISPKIEPRLSPMVLFVQAIMLLQADQVEQAWATWEKGNRCLEDRIRGYHGRRSQLDLAQYELLRDEAKALLAEKTDTAQSRTPSP